MKFRYLLISFLVLLTFANVNAGPDNDIQYEFGIAPGMLFSGDIYVSLHGGNVKQNSNYLIRSYADAFIIPRLAFGVYFNYSSLNLEKDVTVFGETIKKSGTPIWEIGGAIKPRFVLNEKITVKPGFNIGHRRFSGDSKFTKWKGLAMNASCEFQYSISEKMRIISETGFLYQPYGGNVDTDITFDPMFYMVFGIGF